MSTPEQLGAIVAEWQRENDEPVNLTVPELQDVFAWADAQLDTWLTMTKLAMDGRLSELQKYKVLMAIAQARLEVAANG
jgi:hypothetical protein